MYLKSKIREINNWPKKGVNFKDITPLIGDPKAFTYVIDTISSKYIAKHIDKIVGIDARGFIFAAPLAYKLKTGLAIVRKSGKLPYQTVSQNYSLEYGENILEMHCDSILSKQNVLIVDDVLATGGTAKAAAQLVKKLGGIIIGIIFLIELEKLSGREKLKDYDVFSLIKY